MTTKASTEAEIIYPETDGMPLPDGEFQAPLYVRILGMLQTFFRNVQGAHVNGNTFLYYVEGNPRRFVSPDCYVAFGLSDAALESLSLQGNNTYLLWEVGKPPDFVLEIGSPSTGRVDVGSKRDLYAELGVPEYWRYDASGGDFYGEALVGERLVDGEYRRFELRYGNDGSVWSHSEVLNLDLWWTDGELQFWDPVGEVWLLSHEEEHEGRLTAEARAEQERVRAEQEQARTERERERADALKAELRRLRGQQP